MEITCIIPTFNRKERLREALESVLLQEGAEFEVVVVDDGSTDGTRDMLTWEFPRVRYFYHENKGPAAARNTGIREARGRWIAFLDSDDLWLPGKLKAQLDFFAAHPGMRICQTEEIWIRNGVRVNPMNKHRKHGGFIFERCLDLCLISPSAVMIEKSLLEEIGYFDETYPACEDYELWLRITAAHECGLIDKPYVKKFGGHPDQRSHEFEAMDLFRINALAKIIETGLLAPAQQDAAEDAVLEKAAIYLKGAEKRNNPDGIKRVSGILKKLELEVPV